eukprot:TRINITY_DN2940_c0_g1_i1.p1 TRINITY_DN2940_c0_g1~~TRINITY_DN2940_c0_g1_i1.p1  ORF type:complete len:394 (-),score=99.99 TRINITY_DN2940_c0_g1_i1:356-1537(-)
MSGFAPCPAHAGGLRKPRGVAKLLTAVCVASALQTAAGFTGMRRASFGRATAPVCASTQVHSARHACQVSSGVTRRRAPSRSGALTMVATEVRPAAVSAARQEQQQQDAASAEAFLPWIESCAGAEHPLLYMPFMDYSLEQLVSQIELQPTPMDEEMALQHSLHPAKPGRIASLLFNGPSIRKARLTYFDAGPAVQVFNMVVYPDPSIDAPILGVDLIAFGKKHLAGIDFQPLHADAGYADRYLSTLGDIKARYPDLSQTMSARFYDSARFFSPHMLFARFEDRDLVPSQLFPAFSEYLSEYVEMLSKAPRVSTPEFRDAVLERHTAYDQYNAERDPAHGLFVQYFGHEWSEKFMDDFLFELSTRPEGGYPKVEHGPPQAKPQQPAQAAAATA